MAQIRVMIADDHEVVRMGIKAMFNQHANLAVIAEAENGEEAVRTALLHKPDVVVMDVRMPVLSGIDACAAITSQLPDTRVVMLTTFAEDDLLFAAIRAGASGYVLKRIGNNELIRTIEAIARGDSALDPAMVASVFREVAQAEKQREASVFGALSAQELRVLTCIADGMTNREIAAKLFLGEGTVRNYVSSILGKLALSNRAEAAAFAVQHRIKDVIGQE